MNVYYILIIYFCGAILAIRLIMRRNHIYDNNDYNDDNDNDDDNDDDDNMNYTYYK